MHSLTKPQRLIYNTQKYLGGASATICGSMLFDGSENTLQLKAALNKLIFLNDALRIGISDAADTPMQYVREYEEADFEVLSFNSALELADYAQGYAKEPMDLYGCLCDIKIITLPEKYGVLVKLHHIISDAWTFSLFGSQLTELLCGKEIESYSYLDCIAEEQKYTCGERLQKDKSYWLEQFKKCDEVTYLSDKNTSDFQSDRKSFAVDRDLTKSIYDFAKLNGVSAYAVLMTAVCVYINRVKMNKENFYVGTAVLNRSGNKQKNTMGMFINTVPLLVELDNEKSFGDACKSIMSSSMSAFRHQKYNYGDILSDIRKEYGFDEKLYDVIVSYQNARVSHLAHGFESSWYPSGRQNESLQVHIEDRDGEGTLKIHYDYLISKFTVAEIEKMHEHIMNLLCNAMQNTDKSIHALEILSDNEKKTLLYNFNDTKADYPKDKCVHQLFEEWAEKAPDKVAVVACDKTLAYQELNEQANRIANALIEKGVKVGDIVAFALPRRSYLIASMLGILKAGAAYMPIDPEYPQDRIDYMKSNADFFISENNVQSLLSNSKAHYCSTNMTQDIFFCTLHTSGSTGTPKCAVITHRNMINFIFSNTFLLDKIENVIAINAVTFDVFEMDTIFALVSGKKCVLASEEQQFIQSEFESMMDMHRHSLFWATPTKMQNYISNSTSKSFLKSIDCYVVGGEVLKDELIDLVACYNSDIAIYTVYGPTETLIYSTIQCLDTIIFKNQL